MSMCLYLYFWCIFLLLFICIFVFANDSWYVSTSVKRRCVHVLTVLLSSPDTSPPLYARWLDMSHDAIFVHSTNICAIFVSATVFATHLGVPNLQPIWPQIKIKHYPLEYKEEGKENRFKAEGCIWKRDVGCWTFIFGLILTTVFVFVSLIAFVFHL